MSSGFGMLRFQAYVTEVPHETSHPPSLEVEALGIHSFSGSLRSCTFYLLGLNHFGGKQKVWALSWPVHSIESVISGCEL